MEKTNVYFAWIIANILDTFTTLYGVLILRFLELNLLANTVITANPFAFVLIKAIITVFAFILPKRVLIAFTIALFCVVLWNSYLIFSII